MDKSHTHFPARTLRKSVYLCLLPCLTLLAANAVHSAPLQEADDFAQLGKTIQEKKIPLLLAFEAEHCNYCTRLKAEHLQPMNNNEGYQQRVLIRTIKLNSSDKIINFNGEETTPSQLSNKYKAFLTPTMLFLNDKGEEVAKRMLGYNSPDYFGLYLDQAIDAAGEKIKETAN